ncbi:MAG: wax ester/triacylglycerol synthase family O-acyltransferase [Acidimicrobiales bacterium]
MDRLTAYDDALLRIEDDVSAVHGMTIGVFEGPQPPFDDVLELVRSRVPMVPRYRQRLLQMPMGLERPLWIDDPHFSLDFHVRNTALVDRRGADALSALVGRLQSQRMDRSKPLWELWVVSNLVDDHWALISKVHYSMIDGVSGTDLFGLLLDEAPTGEVGDDFSPAPIPNRASLIPHAFLDRLFDPMESIRAITDLAVRPVRAVQRQLESARRKTSPNLRTDIGPHRRWHRCQVDLSAVRKARQLHNCSTNDVILAAIVGGVRHYLTELGEPIPKRLVAMIPLAIATEETGFAQQLSAVVAELPLGIEEPIARLDAISAQTALAAQNRGALTADVFRRQAQFLAPTVMALGVRAALEDAHESTRIDTLAVNVPGPDHPQHLRGRRLLKAYPVVPLAGRVPLAFAALSYCDTISFGVTGDYDSSPQLNLVADGIRDAVEQLIE